MGDGRVIWALAGWPGRRFGRAVAVVAAAAACLAGAAAGGAPAASARPAVAGVATGGPVGVTTGAPSGIAGTFATFNGSVTGASAGGTYHFQWGTGSGYQDATASLPLAASPAAQPVSAPVYTGLAAATAYHVRLVVSYPSGGTTVSKTGRPRVFTTKGCTKTARPGGHARLQAFVNSLAAGDVGCLDAGRYGRRGTITLISANGTAAAPVELMRAPGQAKPVFLGEMRLGGDYETVSGLVFDGPSGNVGNSTCPGGQDLLVWIYGGYDQIDHSVLKNDLCRAAVYVGTDSGTPVPDTRLLNNYVRHNGIFNNPSDANVDQGIYLGESTGALVADNIIVDNVAYGIVTWPNVSGSEIVDNTVVGNLMDGIGIEGDGSSPLSSGNIVQDNISVDNGEYGIRSYGTLGSGNLVDHNVVYGNGIAPFYDPANGLTFTGNILADPLFKGPAEGPPPSYALQPGSPALGAADAAQPQDYFGHPRPQQGADIGAWEAPRG